MISSHILKLALYKPRLLENSLLLITAKKETHQTKRNRVDNDIMPNLYWRNSEKSNIDFIMSTKSSYQTS